MTPSSSEYDFISLFGSTAIEIWSPGVVATVTDRQVKVAKLKGSSLG